MDEPRKQIVGHACLGTSASNRYASRLDTQRARHRGSTGGGVLTYKGKQYPFKITGISLGANIGVSKLSAVGEVYDLNDIAKFAGTFTKLDGSITLGGGVGGSVLKNENGVIMRLTSTSQGIQLNLSASGVSVKLDK